MNRLPWLLALFACQGSILVDTDPGGETGDSDSDSDIVEPGPAPDTRAPGPSAAITDSGTLNVGDGCTLSYDRFRPDGKPGSVLVVLVHGFGRSPAQMAGWASHWATWGAEVVTPQMCSLRPFNTDHPANGRHLAALVRNLRGDRTVLLAGHSAGALAVTLAAAEVPVDGILGLDPVDSEGLGEDAAIRLGTPAAALFGEPSSCNAEGNGEAMWAPIQDRTWWRVVSADHCSFESPTDRFCTGFCRRGERDDAAIEGVVLGMSTGWVLWRGGLDPRGEQWWTPGEDRFDEIKSLVALP